MPLLPHLHFFRKTVPAFLLLLAALGACRPDPPPLFEKIPASHSGIRFANALTPSDSLNAFTFTNFYNGGGVGVGDFNHDGQPDLFFTGNQASCRLYLNEGDFRFTDVTESAGVTTNRWCTGVSVVDLNQDGWDDVYLSVAAHPTMRQTRNLLFINQKTVSPTFREEAAAYGLDDVGYTTQAAFFDADLDGDLDAFLLNTAPDAQNPNTLRPAINDGTHPSTSRLFRNDGPDPTGQPRFRDVSRQAGIRYEGLGLGLVVSDLNGDGYPDLYASNDFISSDVLYLNNGNFPLEGATTDVGKGGVTFRNSTRASLAHTSLYGMGVDAADLNNDGRIDLMQLDMLPHDNARLKQMLGAPDFDKKELSLNPQYGYQLQYMRNTLQLNQAPAAPPARSTAAHEGGATLRLQSLPSKLAASAKRGSNVAPPSWAAVERAGGAFFSEIGLLAGVAQTDWSWAALLADYDQDGHKDLFVTNGYRKNVTDRDFISFTEDFNLFGTDQARQQQRDKLLERVPEIKLRNYAFRNRSGDPAGDLTFENVSAAWGLDELSYANGAAYTDLDGDGDLDLVVNNIDQEASLFRNHSRERLKNGFLSLAFVGPPANRAGFGATVTVWAEGGQQVLENYPVRGYLSSVGTGVVLGLGAAPVADSLRVVWPGGLTETRRRVRANQRLQFRITDARPAPKRSEKQPVPLFSRRPDLADFQHQESDFVDFKTTPALHKMLSRAGVALAVGDLNGDAYDDVAVGASYRGSAGALFFGQANGGFTRRDWMPNAPMEVGDILLFDADHDGDNDLLVVGGGNERPLQAEGAFQPMLYRNDGHGNFQPAHGLPPLAVSSQCVRAFDYDRDGDLDVLITGRQIPGKYPLPARSFLLRNESPRPAPPAPEGGAMLRFQSLPSKLAASTKRGSNGAPPSGAGGASGGAFTDVTAQVVPGLANLGLVCDALPLDVDGDHDEDLVLVGEWMPLTILKNENGRFSHSITPSLSHSSGWWNCVAAGDFDHDGDADLLLGNEGLNTLYRASPTEPIQIFGNDFNDDGQFDPILGYVIDGTRYPALPRDALNQQVIQFRRKFLRYADYARAEFKDLFSENELQGAYRGQVHELRSCYAENTGGGQFRLRPLPMLTQQAPIFGFVVDDFDRDGHLDALATGNFFANEANLGRQDASRGLLLRGDGRGGFVAWGPERSGFSVPGDARRSYPLRNPARIITAVNGGPLVLHGWYPPQ